MYHIYIYLFIYIYMYMYIELFIYLYSTIYIDTMGRTCIKIEYLIYTNMYEMDRFKGNLRETIAFTVKM